MFLEFKIFVQIYCHLTVFVFIGQYIEEENFECDPPGKARHYLLAQAKLKCEGDPNCDMIVEYLGSGVKFKFCPPGSLPKKSSKGSILYIKGNIEKYAIHKILN